MKSFVIFALLFVGTQVKLPAHGKVIGRGDNSNIGSNNHAQSSQKLTSANRLTETNQASNGQVFKNKNNEDQAQGKMPGIRAAEAPPSFWRKREWIGHGANLVLAVVGVGGILAAFITLAKLERQTKSSEDAANAAKLNAQAIINAERAWIKVTPHIGSPSFFPSREKDAPIPDDLVDVLPIAHQFPAKLVNVGKTPAKIEASAMRYIRTSTHPDTWNHIPDYGELTEFEQYAFPDDILTITAELSPVATMTKSQIEAVEDNKEFLFAFGIIKYRDVYGNPHETRFGYIYATKVRHLVMKDNVIHTIRTGEPQFQLGGPPRYNGHT